MYQLALTFAVLVSSFTLLYAETVQAKKIKIQPGLWEIRTSSDLLRLLPHIPAEQMQNMQNLAKEYGLEMPEIENGAAISQICITQEMDAQDMVSELYQEELGCITNGTIRKGNTYKMSFTCKSPKLKGNGTAKGVVTSPQTFIGSSRFKGQLNGADVVEKAEFAGKWLSTSCVDKSANSKN
ncbi:MAG TPA: DUF3617 domain-containing protein [Methylophilaceae bacterium]|nr:DUF3617 domain-containing protein [Methylophilaceae bacterium]